MDMRYTGEEKDPEEDAEEAEEGRENGNAQTARETAGRMESRAERAHAHRRGQGLVTGSYGAHHPGPEKRRHKGAARRCGHGGAVRRSPAVHCTSAAAAPRCMVKDGAPCLLTADAMVVRIGRAQLFHRPGVLRRPVLQHARPHDLGDTVAPGCGWFAAATTKLPLRSPGPPTGPGAPRAHARAPAVRRKLVGRRRHEAQVRGFHRAAVADQENVLVPVGFLVRHRHHRLAHCGRFCARPPTDLQGCMSGAALQREDRPARWQRWAAHRVR